MNSPIINVSLDDDDFFDSLSRGVMSLTTPPIVSTVNKKTTTRIKPRERKPIETFVRPLRRISEEEFEILSVEDQRVMLRNRLRIAYTDERYEVDQLTKAILEWLETSTTDLYRANPEGYGNFEVWFLSASDAVSFTMFWNNRLFERT